MRIATNLSPDYLWRHHVRRMPIAMLALLASSVAADQANELAWEGGVTAIFQDADDSEVAAELTASADLFVTLPRAHGEWLLYIEASTAPKGDGVASIYPTANADAGSVLDRDGDSHVQISEFHYTFNLANERSLMIGLVNPSAWLDRSDISNDENAHFLNGNFKNNATIEFLDYTAGAIMRWLGSESRPETTLVLASSDGIADLPDRSYQELLDLSSDQRGIFLGADSRWLRNRTSLRLGAWLRTDKHAVAGRPGEMESNYGIYGVLGWHSGQHAMDIRYGLANEDVSIATQFAAVAYERSTSNGLFGLAVAATRVANAQLQSGRSEVFSAEAFYRIPIADDIGHISPSIQLVQRPRLDPADESFSSSALVASVRFHWPFDGRR